MTWVDATSTVCIDFNGVLDTYKGYANGFMYPPRDGAAQFLQRLEELEFCVVICTSAEKHKVEAWLAKYDMLKYVSDVTNKKVPAIVYLDDRGITFTGDFKAALDAICTFKAYWEDDEHVETPRRDINGNKL